MDSLSLARKIADIILDKQGDDILILDLIDISSFTDYFVICSAQSRRQLNAISSAIQQTLKQEPKRVLPKNVEGTADSGWVLMDYGDIIVHLFEAKMRHYYQLETLWDNGRIVTRIQ